MAQEDYADLARLAVITAQQHRSITEASIYVEYIELARRYFRFACRRDPNNLELKLELVDTFNLKSDNEEGVSILNDILSKTEDAALLSRANYLLGEFAFAEIRDRGRRNRPTEQEYKAALDYYRLALKLNPSNTDAAVMLADELNDLGFEYSEPIRILKRSLRACPNNPAVLSQLGYICFSAGEWSKALKAYIALAAARPLQANEESHCAICLFNTGKIIQGIKRSILSRDLHDREFAADISHYVPDGFRDASYDQLLIDTAKKVQADLSDMETRAMLAMLLQFSGYGDARNHADALIDRIDKEDRGHFETLAERATIRINDELEARGITDARPFRNPWPPADPTKEYQDKPYHKVIILDPRGNALLDDDH